MRNKLDLKDAILIEKEKIAILSFNRDDIRNALTGSDLIEDIKKTVAYINSNQNISVLVITGKGKAFSSGGNIKEMTSKDGSFSGSVAEIEKKYRYGIQQIPKTLETLEVPSIACVNGPAIGAGFDLACMCDIRIMSKKAFFSESFLNLGIIPGDGGGYFLTRLIGYQKAAELTFTGRKVFPEEALKMGLVLKVVEEEELINETFNLAKEIACKPSTALRYSKRLLKKSDSLSLNEYLDLSALFQGISHNTKEQKNILKKIKKKPS